jgi:hypothetical protein
MIRVVVDFYKELFKSEKREFFSLDNDF